MIWIRRTEVLRRTVGNKTSNRTPNRKVPDFAQVLDKYCATASQRPSMPNSWSYVLEQPGRSTAPQEEAAAAAGAGTTPASSRPTSPSTGGGGGTRQNPASLITKFTKVLSQEERAMVGT